MMAAGFGFEPNRTGSKPAPPAWATRKKDGCAPPCRPVLQTPLQRRAEGPPSNAQLNRHSGIGAHGLDSNGRHPAYRAGALPTELREPLIVEDWGDASVSIRSKAESRSAGFACSLASPSRTVMPGRVPGIHENRHRQRQLSWIARTSPAMTD